MTKLSIITATWNSASTLPDTLKSIESQTYKDFELIVVDGGSTDSTVDLIKNNHLVDRWVSEKDKGIYDALNKGIALASGEYVGFMHSDDIFASSTSLEMLVNHIENYGKDAIYADLEYVQKGDTSKVVRYWKSGEFSRRKISWGWMPPHPTFYMKKSLYEKFGSFNLEYRIAADYDSLMRYIFQYNISLSYLPEVLVKMRVGGESNRSLKNIIKKSKEDMSVMHKAGIPVLTGMFGKNFGKITQFL